MNTSSLTQNGGYRTYAKVSDEDWDWFVDQKPCIQQLWGECMRAEKYGESFNKIETRLSKNSFSEAKRELDGTRFEFKPVQRLARSGQYKTVGWKVRNLHGSKIKEYWSHKDSEEKVSQNLGELSQDVGGLSQNLGEPAPVAFDTTAFDSSLLSFYNPSIISELKEEDSSLTKRSGRLELDSSAKATESAPSPDAEITRKETRSFATEEDPWNDPTPLVDHQNSRNCEERLVGVNEEKDIATAPKDDGSVETNITPPISRTFRDENAPEPAPTSPPVESSTEPPKPAAKPHVAASESVSGEVYREARRKYQDRGLNFRYSDQNWSAFEKALCQGKLATIAEGFQANKVVLPPQWVEDLMSDYLFYPEDKGFTEPQVCIRDNSELKLVPWSHLPAIVSKSVPELKSR